MRTLRLFTLLFGAVYLPLMVYSIPAVALECTFGSVPFDFARGEGIEGSITSDVVRDVPLYSVIPEVGQLVAFPSLYAGDVSCKPPAGSMLLPIVNVSAPPVIRTISYNGNTYDVYATNQSWAGYIVLRDNSKPFVNGGVLELTTYQSIRPKASMYLNVEFVKLENPFNGTVGQLYVWLQPLGGVSFDITLPDGRNVNMATNFEAASVDVMGVVCSLNAPPELDVGDVAIGDLKQPGTLAAVNLALGINCGSGHEMVGQRVPDSMQVQFMGGTEPGLLDSDQANVKFQINDRHDQALAFSRAYEAATLTDDGNLTADNAINLSVKPMLKDINGSVTAGNVGGNLAIQVIYK